MNTFNQEALSIESRVKDLRTKIADEDMAFRYSNFQDAFGSYNNDYMKFKNTYVKYEKAKDAYDDAYAHLKRSYMERCRPLEDLYGVRLKCSKIYHRAMDEFLAREKHCPHCEIGSKLPYLI